MTPKHEGMNFYDVHMTSDSTPFYKNQVQTPQHPVNVTRFNLKNVSPTFGKTSHEIDKMFHNTAPPAMHIDSHYHHTGPISNFADVDINERKPAPQVKISSFQNANDAISRPNRPPAHSSFISVTMMKHNREGANDNKNEFSHDIMMKIKDKDQPSNEKSELKEIVGNFLSVVEEDNTHEFVNNQ